MSNSTTQAGGTPGSPAPQGNPADAGELTQPVESPAHAVESAAPVDATIPPRTILQTTPSQLMSAATDLSGDFGPYRIERLLGRGGMGCVYLATDSRLERRVALKVPNFSQLSSDLTERFLREARTAATLNHPNICPVYEVGEHAGHRYIAMGFIEGRTLADYIRPGRVQPERQIAGTVRKIAVALAEAHSHGIVHRDLKPANIMIDRRNEPILMDFGLARRTDVEETQPLTQEGLAIGTPAYMSPEQVEGRPDVGPTSDVFSLGVILYELLAGARPFQGNIASIVGQILHTEPRPLRELRPNVSEDLTAICLRAMKKKPAERFASMKEFAEALTSFLSSRGSTTMLAAVAPAGAPASSSPSPIERPEQIEWERAADDWDKLDIPQRVPPRRSRVPASRGGARRDDRTSRLLLMIGGPAAAALCVIAAVLVIRTFRGGPETKAAPVAGATSAAGSTDVAGASNGSANANASPASGEGSTPLEVLSEPPPVEGEPALPDDKTGPRPASPDDPGSQQPPSGSQPQKPEPSPKPDPAGKPPEASPPSKPEPTTGGPGPAPSDGSKPAQPRPGEPPPPGQGGPPDIDREMTKFDANKDGVLTEDELPPHVMVRADGNKDGKVTKKEFKTAYEKYRDRLHAPPGSNERQPPPPPRGKKPAR